MDFQDNIFKDITDETSNDEILQNQIPKLNTKKVLNMIVYYKLVDDKNYLIFIDTSNPDLLELFNQRDFETIEKDYQLFWVSERYMDKLLNGIIKTTGRFVLPANFTKFITSSLQISEKIMLPEDLLFKLRIWSNQIRDIYLKTKNNKEYLFNKKIKYICYNICSILLFNAKYIK